MDSILSLFRKKKGKKDKKQKIHHTKKFQNNSSNNNQSDGIFITMAVDEYNNDKINVVTDNMVDTNITTTCDTNYANLIDDKQYPKNNIGYSATACDSGTF